MPGLSSAGCPRPGFTSSFGIERCGGFSTTGSNPYFPLKPGLQLVLEGTEGDELVRVVITVLNETMMVDGVRTRVVEERETIDGQLVEVSRNYFAVCNRTDSVFYFGEDVDIYENGVIVTHEGAWRSGIDGARAGIIMPGEPLNGARYYQEIAPGVALDRAEIISTNRTVLTPAGEFENCVKTEETTPLEPKATDYKFYAPGIGLVVDGVLKLISFSGN
jgi:hypothetical protein